MNLVISFRRQSLEKSALTQSIRPEQSRRVFLFPLPALPRAFSFLEVAMLMTANPCADAERWENARDRRAEAIEAKAAEMLRLCSPDLIDAALEEGVPREVLVKLARAMRTIGPCFHEGRNDGALRDIGMVMLEWMNDFTFERARHA